MKKLRRIMEIQDPDARVKGLIELAQKLGVSISYIESDWGKVKENILIERIEQRYTILLSKRGWMLAVISAIASVFSALAAWMAILSAYCRI